MKISLLRERLQPAFSPDRATPLLAVVAMIAVAGCAATLAPRPLTVGQRAVVEGRVSRVDRSPMAYDGDGLLVLATTAQGEVTLHFAARRNLCRAQGLELYDTATVGMRVQASGTVTGPGDLSVCGDANDYLKRTDRP